MAILEELLRSLPSQPVPLRSVLAGVHWTAVASRGCGLSASLRDETLNPRPRVRDVGRLLENSAQELAGWALSANLLEASIGVAALNSLIEVDETQGEEINAFEVLVRLGEGKNVAVVGHFPFVDRLREIARNCWVIEKQPRPGDYPAEAAPDLLPQADVIAVTGTALTNHTLEGLLAHCPPQAVRMLLGPSTPLSPVLFNYGFDYLSGARVVDETKAILTIQQGAVFPQVQGVRLVTITRNDATSR